MNVVCEIQAFNAGREVEVTAHKYRARRVDPFSFLSGTCPLLFYAQRACTGSLKSAPVAQVCGDLHLQDFGSHEGNNRWVCAGRRAHTASQTRELCRREGSACADQVRREASSLNAAFDDRVFNV